MTKENTNFKEINPDLLRREHESGETFVESDEEAKPEIENEDGLKPMEGPKAEIRTTGHISVSLQEPPEELPSTHTTETYQEEAFLEEEKQDPLPDVHELAEEAPTEERHSDAEIRVDLPNEDYKVNKEKLDTDKAPNTDELIDGDIPPPDPPPIIK